MNILAELRRVLGELEYAIALIMRDYEDPWMVRTTDGRYMFLDALTAKANVLVAIAQLESKEDHGRRTD